MTVGETTVQDPFLYLLADLSTFVWILLDRLDRPVRETVLVSCTCSCVRGVLLGVLRVPRVLACVRPHPASIREDRATLEDPFPHQRGARGSEDVRRVRILLDG